MIFLEFYAANYITIVNTIYITELVMVGLIVYKSIIV